MKLKYFLYILILITIVHCPLLIQAQNDEYRKTLEMADNYFAQGDYINAKASYQIAVRLAPEDSYPKEMLQQSLAMIRQQMSQSALYSEKIVVADELYAQKDHTGALKFYQDALNFLPGDTYATGKIAEINNTLKENREREELYANAIGAADQYLKAGKFEEALAEFKKASGIKPAEEYPKSQAAQIEKQLAEQKALAGDYESAIAAADEALKRNKFDEAIRQLQQAAALKPEESLPEEKLAEVSQRKAEFDAYAGIIEEGDNLYISKDFNLAREKYLQASTIDPSDDYPKNMLEKIDIALMDINKANASSYEVAIALADKYYNEKDYERAMAEYRNALRFKPDESYAQQKINNINQTLSVIKSQQEAYAQTIAKADNLFMARSYAEAKEEYQRAIGINAFEQYPRVKIDEINVILAELQNQREIYNSLIKGADKLFFADNYVEALEQYHKASDMFPRSNTRSIRSP